MICANSEPDRLASRHNPAPDTGASPNRDAQGTHTLEDEMHIITKLGRIFSKPLRSAALVALAALPTQIPAQAAAQTTAPRELRLDYAYYNPVSLVLKEKGWLEEDLKKDGIAVRWVLSAGSNKALEFLNSESIDFGSTAGAAALLAKVAGNPIKSIYVFSKPEWTALVTNPSSGIKTVADLKGKRIAVTRGTDPHIFLIRALAGAGLKERDAKLILLQHADGRLALEKGDVDAWAGLDPMMAQAELEKGATLFFRNADLNTYGILNVREEFATKHPELVGRVLAAYERARLHSRQNPEELKSALANAAKLSDQVALRQLERTDITDPVLGEKQRSTIEAAGIALQEAGVIKPDVDVKAVVNALFDTRFATRLSSN